MNKIFLNLGLQPLANRLLDKKELKKKELKLPLKIQFNTKSFLVSLKNTVSSKEMFNDKYPYRSSSSKTINNEYKKLSNKIKKTLKPKSVLEVGSNDGTFLKYFDKRTTVGIEPVKKHAKITKKNGFFTYDNFWTIKLANQIAKKYKKFDLIFSANTLSHIHDLDESIKAIKLLLNTNGTFILEDPSLLKIILNNAYDQFYDEHIYVFSTLALKNILIKHNLEIYKIENLKTHGGSNRYYICKSGLKKIEKSFFNNIKNEKKSHLHKIIAYKNFSIRINNSRKNLKELLIKLKNNNKKIIGYGASAKSTLIFNYCKLTSSEVSYFTDSTKDKQNKYLPGVKIEIRKQPMNITSDVDYSFLGAWNFYEEIKIKERNFLKNGGRFITHVPYPRILK